MKKTFLRIVLVVIIAVIPVFNGVRLYIFGERKAAADEYIDVYKPESASDVNDVISYIDGLVEQRAKQEEEIRIQMEREEKFNLFLEDIKNGRNTFRKAFSDVLIVGDSLMQGLNTYRVLDSSNMIAMVSASLYHLEGNVERIISNNPKKLVTHYGINMLVDSEGYLNSFILQYTRILIRLKNALPDTEIYVSGIFDVAPCVKGRYSAIEKYNARLSKMCDELDVNYLDNSSFLPGDGEYYGSDGIHVSKGFYTEVWLPQLYYEIYLK